LKSINTYDLAASVGALGKGSSIGAGADKVGFAVGVGVLSVANNIVEKDNTLRDSALTVIKRIKDFCIFRIFDVFSVEEEGSRILTPKNAKRTPSPPTKVPST
jgi:hypothetical protein